MTRASWHHFTQPYEPREHEPDPFYEKADRAAVRDPLQRESLSQAPDAITLERTR